MGTTFSQGQLAKLGNNLNIAVATALPEVAAKFDPKSLLKAMEGRGQFVADKLGLALEQILNSLFVLGTPGTTTVTISERHDPDAFFRTGSGLYVYDSFRNRVVSKARPTEAGVTFDLGHGLLTESMVDKKIEDSLPKAHIFDESVVCAVTAATVKGQSDGREGKLLNNGCANLFYTSSCVVDVHWSAGHREWVVDTWERGGGKWSAGIRVFSPATVA